MLWAERRLHLEEHAASIRRILGVKDDDLGLLLDRARSVLSRGKLNEADHARVHEFCDFALLPERDWRHYCSLDVSQHSKVDIVQCPAEGAGRVYVRKAVTKDFATRMRGQCSPFNERDLLVASLEQRRQSPYIPELLAALQDDDFLYLFIEYMPSGTLLDALECQPRHMFGEAEVRFWTAEAMEAISWVHSCGLAHRDIKPNNLLLTRKGHIKLTDFGSSAHFDASMGQGPYAIDASYCLAPVGTVDYLAPDILLAHQAALDANDSDFDGELVEGNDVYGPDVDWWSLGVTIYELLYGTTPFYAATIPETYELIARSEEFLRFPAQPPISATAMDLLSSMLAPAEERIGRFFGAEELKQHSYFDAIDFPSLHKSDPPFAPEARDFPPPSRQASLEPEQSMSIFASPGLSFLHPAASEMSGEAWDGFSYLPVGDAFDNETVDKAMIEQSVVTEASRAFSTPARGTMRSASGSACRSRDRRALGDNMQALRELADYGALKSAQKRRSASRGVDDDDEETAGHMTPPASTRPRRASPSRKGSLPRALASEEGEPMPSFILAPRNLSSDSKTRSRQTSLEDTRTPQRNTKPVAVKTEPSAEVNRSLDEIHSVWSNQARLASKLGHLESRFDQLSLSTFRA